MIKPALALALLAVTAAAALAAGILRTLTDTGPDW